MLSGEDQGALGHVEHQGAVLGGAEHRDVPRLQAVEHGVVRVAIAVVASGADDGHERVDGVEERCGGAGSASVVAELQHVRAHVQGREPSLCRRLGLSLFSLCRPQLAEVVDSLDKAGIEPYGLKVLPGGLGRFPKAPQGDSQVHMCVGVKRVNPDGLAKAGLRALVVSQLEQDLSEVVVCLGEVRLETDLLPEMLSCQVFLPLARPDNSQ